MFSSVLLSREGKGEVMSEKQVFKTTWGGRPLQIEVGQLAKQANGAVLVRYEKDKTKVKWTISSRISETVH
ncbi:hypothetical protein EfmAA96_01820 [Enterococcus faecium]|nr:hypothetical protein EfmAA96_01820 [Enterococcus faecium]